MADSRLQIVIDAINRTAGVFSEIGRDIEAQKRQIETLSKSFAVAGGAIVGALTLSVKAAEESRVSIALLDQSLKNVGVSYQQNTAAIEGTIAALQHKTSFSDEQQREALSNLIGITQSYDASLSALPTVLDLAAARQMDLGTAAIVMGRALTGNTEMLGRYGIKVQEGATATEVLAELTARFGGQAAATADPIKQLTNDVGDLAEQIGNALLPSLREATEQLREVARGAQDWAKANPDVFNGLVKIVAVAGGVLSFLAALGFALPLIEAGFAALVGPIGLVTLALVALSVEGFVVVTHWQTISSNFLRITEDFVNLVIGHINRLIMGINQLPGALRALFGINQEIPTIPIVTLAPRTFGLEGPQPVPQFGPQPISPQVSKSVVEAGKDIETAQKGVTGSIDMTTASLNLYTKQMMFARDFMRSEFDQAMKDLEQAGLSAGDAFIIASIQIGDQFSDKLSKMAETAKNGKAVLEALRDGVIDVATAVDLLNKMQLAGGGFGGGFSLAAGGPTGIPPPPFAIGTNPKFYEQNRSVFRTLNPIVRNGRLIIQVVMDGKVVSEVEGDLATQGEQVRSS